MADPSQLSGWFETHGRTLVLYARQWLDSCSAEDLVQDVFLRLMSQWKSPENPKAWLFRSVRNGAVSRLRSKKRRFKHEQRLSGEKGSAWFDIQLDELIDAKTAQAALEKLPDEQREVVILRIWGDLTLQEVADIVGAGVDRIQSIPRSADGNPKGTGVVMHDEEQLNSAERELEAALGTLKPAGTALSRDQMLFRAGQLSSRRRARFWQGTSLLLAAFVGLSLARQPQPRLVERPVQTELEQFEAEGPLFANATLEYARNNQWHVINLD